MWSCHLRGGTAEPAILFLHFSDTSNYGVIYKGRCWESVSNARPTLTNSTSKLRGFEEDLIKGYEVL